MMFRESSQHLAQRAQRSNAQLDPIEARDSRAGPVEELTEHGEHPHERAEVPRQPSADLIVRQ